MITVTFTELRNHARKYFDAVEAGESVEIFRNGKPVARLSPYQATDRNRWKEASPLRVRGVSLSKLLLAERKDAR